MGVSEGERLHTKAFFHRLGLIAYTAEPAGEVTDDVFKALSDPAGPHANGLTVAIATRYKKQDNNNQEIGRQADDFATTYNAISVQGGKLVIGKAVHIEELPQVVEAIRAVHRTVSAKAPAAKEGEAAPAWTLIRNVALFAHGMHYGMSLDKDNSYSKGLHAHDARNAPANIEAFAGAIKSAVHTEVDIQLFACNTGRDVDYLEERRNIKGKTPEKAMDESTYREWTHHDQGDRTGEGSFADELAEAMGPSATAYGHGTAGHTHANFAAKVFGRRAGEGEGGQHMFDVLYPPTFVDSEVTRLAPDLDDALKPQAATIVREAMWTHYKDSISAEHKRPKADKRYTEPVGRGMFMNPDQTRSTVQADWTSKWLPGDREKSLKDKLDGLKEKKAAK